MIHRVNSGRPAIKLSLVAVATIVVLAILSAPAAAAPALSITGYKITSDLPAFPTTPSDGPSTPQAGANPNAGSFHSFAYSNGTEDIKTALTNFAPGLLGNPEAVPKCPQAALEAGGSGCPASSAIGTSRLDTFIPMFGVAGPSFAGTVYNAEPLGNEPGRLGIVTPTGATTFLVSSIPFEITPRPGGDYGLTGTLTDISRLPPPPIDLQVAALGFVLNGSTNKYVRNPTSCGTHTSTGQAIGWDDPTVVDGPAYTFTTSGCDTVPFGPSMSLQIGDRGTTKLNGYPPLVVKITQPPGEADELGNKVTLPVELNSNNSAYKLCTQAQADADACPANSKFGGAVAKSPFLNEPLVGPVYLVQQAGRSLPGLLLDLRGRAHVKIETTTQLVNGKQIQSLVLNAPQLPVSELTVALNGGKTTGVFQNRSDLCFKGSSSSKFNPVNGLVKFYGQNGKNTADTKLTAKVIGCGPGVTGHLSGGTRRPTLGVTAFKHPDAQNMKELIVSLSRNLTLVKGKLNGGASGTASANALGGASFQYLDPHELKVTGLPATGAATVNIELRTGAVQLSHRTQRLLDRGRSRKFRVKVRQTPVSGPVTATRARFKAKR